MHQVDVRRPSRHGDRRPSPSARGAEQRGGRHGLAVARLEPDLVDAAGAAAAGSGRHAQRRVAVARSSGARARSWPRRWTATLRGPAAGCETSVADDEADRERGGDEGGHGQRARPAEAAALAARRLAARSASGPAARSSSASRLTSAMIRARSSGGGARRGGRRGQRGDGGLSSSTSARQAAQTSQVRLEGARPRRRAARRARRRRRRRPLVVIGPPVAHGVTAAGSRAGRAAS